MNKIKISPLFIILAAVMIFFGFWYEFSIYIVCIVLHELAHAETARKLGYSLNHIKLMPYGAGLTGEFESAKWSDEILIAIAGPLFNVIIALFFTSLWWLAPVTYFFTEKLVWANFFTAVFNILPVFPLDGGRVLLAALSAKHQRQKAYKRLRITGYVFCAVFLALFVLSLIYKINISFAFISFFLLISTVIPDKNSKYQRLYSMAFRSEKIKKGLIVREIVISDNVTLLALMRQINSNYFYRFLIVDKDMKNTAIITESDLEFLLMKNQAGTLVSAALKTVGTGLVK